ncbi:hypothetical protein [Nocardia beijingensis]|uniref:hypothetical protein n=1 Tax=Nocardia beijingensis TaxID=95162 RepID=UPI00082D12C5|nr:hypothetical protein [Nocardia beijingensis]
MPAFSFQMDEAASALIWDIVREMMERFQITEEEAIIRINSRFRGLALTEYDIIFHEDSKFWAKDIMYGHTFWWKNESEAERIPLDSLLDDSSEQ